MWGMGGGHGVLENWRMGVLENGGSERCEAGVGDHQVESLGREVRGDPVDQIPVIGMGRV